ncbi:hypothetical protein [Solirubrobacter soli]|uniref:hypothetical protein n=1 Tax=Solirubrobacter soli TaxID=363832 RepID=UPI000407E4FC|nr:hypothetical protein [Solirubrobacter soli]
MLKHFWTGAALAVVLAFIPANAHAADPPFWGIKRPVISGTYAVGQPLSCSDGEWAYSLASITKSWGRGSQRIDTGSTHVVTADDIGSQLICLVEVVSVEGYRMGALSDPYPETTSTQPPAATPGACASSTPSEVHLADRLGDNQGISPDLAEVVVRMDATCTLSISAVFATSDRLPPNAVMYLDADGNAATGSTNGEDLALNFSTRGVSMTPWNPGKQQWANDQQRQLPIASFGATGFTLSASPNDLGIPSGVNARFRLGVGDAGNEEWSTEPNEPWLSFSVAYSASAPPVSPQPPTPTVTPTAKPRLAGKGPALTGTARVGKRLTCSAGTWTGAPKLTYAWKRNGKSIEGQVKKTYTVRKADRGKKLTCAVTGANAGGTKTVTTRAVRIKK